MDGKQDTAIKDDNASPDASVAQHPTPPSSSFTAFKLKNYNELCVDENELPSSNIAELWQKPVNSFFATSKTPKGRRKVKPQHTPTARRNNLPPTKLTFDNMDNNENESPSNARRAGYRRSLSYPESGTGASLTSNYDTPSCSAKRLRLLDENSPYEDLVGTSCSKTSSRQTGGQLLEESSSSLTPVVKRLFLSKSQSDSILSSCNIKSALEKIEGNPNLIGDGTRFHQLPLKTGGKHPDLKEIDGQILADLISRKEGGESLNFRIIDCRYPYEYDGGHIKGAENLFTRNQVRYLIERKASLTPGTASSSPSKENENISREILIFHCEFSSHRAPTLCRFLRDADRLANVASYPFLYYPEIYVLYGGYKAFFHDFMSFCEPQTYITMDDPNYSEAFKKFKSESKLGT
ncbi:unnamed protein product [Orchesella dallaii]|uniref:M-phase inducer phosphatase n=1 Tax=Orchesella dallaii TaxID=48710 RepID=A0ABP1R8M1_9HEXA